MPFLSYAPPFGDLIMLCSESGIIVLNKNGLCHGKALFIIEYEHEMHPVTYSKRKKGSLGRHLK
jgi:hypothetical protein